MTGATPQGPRSERAAYNGVVGASVSPSLRGGARGGRVSAYEVKFLLGEGAAREVEDRLRGELTPDPHSDPALGGMYEVRNLALDDAEFGVFYQEERTRYLKHRVRRYGTTGAVFLERKRSRRGRVKKRRAEATWADVEALATGGAVGAAHSWFAREVREAGLAPVCRVRYVRRAYYGDGGEGAMRVTFDRGVRGALTRAWAWEGEGPERALLEGVVVCEFKFERALPSSLKGVMSAMRLEPTAISKYRACVRAFAAELGVRPGEAGTGVNGA